MDKALRAHNAARAMLASPDQARMDALNQVADALLAAAPAIHDANQQDLADATAAGLDAPLLQRLHFGPDKLATVVDGLRQVATLADPVGRTVRHTDMDDDLHLWQVTQPIGVIACIFESRPDVCVQIPALTIRTANAVLLKGGKEAARTNAAIIQAIQEALEGTAIPPDAVQLLEDRTEVTELLALDSHVDLIVPRGGNDLVRHIQQNTRIPVLGHAAGICHIYVDGDADLEKAERIVIDAKLDSPSACNAVETLLVHKRHRDWLTAFMDRLQAAGITVHAGDADWDKEYGSPELNVRIVSDIAEAVDHIARHGSGHTDAIITENQGAMRAFVDSVDSAGVFVNASTRFADGYRYGLGAEVGISTGKIHARGPVGVEGLVTTRWILVGDGHRAADYHGNGFQHIHHDPDPDAYRKHAWEVIHARS